MFLKMFIFDFAYNQRLRFRFRSSQQHCVPDTTANPPVPEAKPIDFELSSVEIV